LAKQQTSYGPFIIRINNKHYKKKLHMSSEYNNRNKRTESVNHIQGRKILHMFFKAINQQNYYVYHTSNSYELPKLQHTGTKATIL